MSISERLRKNIGNFILIFICALLASIPLWAGIIRGDEVNRYFENASTGEIVERLDETLLYEYFIECGFEFDKDARLCQNCNKLYDRDYNDGSDDYCDNCDSKNKYCNVCTESPRSIDELSNFEYNGETYYICTGCMNHYIKIDRDIQEYILENDNW